MCIDDVIGVCEQLIQRPYDTGAYHVKSSKGEELCLVKRISGVDFPVEYKEVDKTDVKNIVLGISLLKEHWNGIHL